MEDHCYETSFKTNEILKIVLLLPGVILLSKSTHLLWCCGYSRLIATLKAGFYNHLSQITQVIFRVSKKSQFVCLCRYKFCKCGPRFNEENTRHSPSFLACRPCYMQCGRARGQGERAEQAVQVSTSAFVSLSTGDRLSVAFCNPDAFLRRDPIWAGVLL